MRTVQPHAVFFPAALGLGLLAVAVRLADMQGLLPLALPVYWHGHEMLSGLALGIVGGYLLPMRRPVLLAVAAACWLLARGVILVPDLPVAAMIVGLLAYPLLLGIAAGGRFLTGAKTARNLVFVPVLGSFALAEAVFAAGRAGWLAAGERIGLTLLAGLILILLFTMGGRVIAAASSGAHQRMGRRLKRAAQPRLEAVGLLMLGAMLATDIALPDDPAGGVPAALAAGIILLRLWQWQAWRLVRQAGVAMLHLGYLWLALGLAFKAWGQTIAVMPWAGALHPALIGGFGTLALVMIMRTTLQRARLPVVMPGAGVVACGLLSLAALARAESVLSGHMAAMTISAAAWSLALGLMLVWLLRTYSRAGRSRSGA